MPKTETTLRTASITYAAERISASGKARALAWDTNEALAIFILLGNIDNPRLHLK